MALKKGQITLFIIIGLAILIIASAGFYFFSRSRSLESADAELPLQVQPVKAYIDACIRSTTADGIYMIGKQGGYYSTPNLYQDYNFSKVPFYYMQGQKNVPEKDLLERELSAYLPSNLIMCLDDFSSLKEQGYNIETGELKASTTIADENVIVNVDFPVKIMKDSTIDEISKFSYYADFNLYEKYDFADKIVDEQKKNGDYMPLGYLNSISYLNGFRYNLINMDGAVVLVDLVFDEKLKDEPFEYMFAMKYSW